MGIREGGWEAGWERCVGWEGRRVGGWMGEVCRMGG